jgi:hypothetical protein
LAYASLSNVPSNLPLDTRVMPILALSDHPSEEARIW